MFARHALFGALLSLLMLGLAGSAAMAAAPAPGKSINSATMEDLQTVKGVGEKTAAKIVAERTAHGPFKSLEDMQERVRGVGVKTVEHFRAAGWVVTGGVAPTTPAPTKAPTTPKTTK